MNTLRIYLTVLYPPVRLLRRVIRVLLHHPPHPSTSQIILSSNQSHSCFKCLSLLVGHAWVYHWKNVNITIFPILNPVVMDHFSKIMSHRTFDIIYGFWQWVTTILSQRIRSRRTSLPINFLISPPHPSLS